MFTGRFVYQNVRTVTLIRMFLMLWTMIDGLHALKLNSLIFKNKVEGDQVVSVFFGGGTPSLMKPYVVEGILNHIHDLWDVKDGL